MSANELTAGFHVMVASVEGVYPKHKLTKNHMDFGFFRTVNYARHAARLGKGLGKGYCVVVRTNFVEMDQAWGLFFREWYCYDGGAFLEGRWYLGGTHVPTLQEVESLCLPAPPQHIKDIKRGGTLLDRCRFPEG